MQSILYGVGLGPGDPDLITVKALTILKQVDRIFAPSSRDGHSLAGEIVKIHLPEAPLEYLNFPMTEDREQLQSAWELAISTVGNFVNGKSAAFVSLGDPFLYGSYLYLYQGIKNKFPDVELVTIPGVPGMCAAAARSNFYLTTENDRLLLLTGKVEFDLFQEYCRVYQTIVIYKPNSHIKELIQEFCKFCPQGDAMMIERCGMKGEKITKLDSKFNPSTVDYFSIIILHTQVPV